MVVVTSTFENNNSVIYKIHCNKVTTNTFPIANKDNDDFNDLINEAFDNIQHPMELILLNRSCISYIAM